MHLFGQLLIPGLVLLLVGSLMLIARVLITRYQKIPPNKVAIIYGRGTRTSGQAGAVKGCKVVSGGGVMVWPVVQEIDFMDTAVFSLPIKETNIPNKDNVKITVGGYAACKISTADEDLQSAAMSFLGQEPDQIQRTVSSLLIGHLRSIIGKLTIDEILRDRDAFNKMVVNETAPELKKMGIQIVSLVIQDVNDEYKYIESLGKRAVAEAVRDANIKVAQADAETVQKVSTAKREAAIVEANNAVAVAEAGKDRDVKIANFKVTVDTENAKANQALAIATADQEKTLKVKQAERDAAEKNAQIAVQEKEAVRMQKQLEATTIQTAEAERKRVVIAAEGTKTAAITTAEGQKQAAILTAQAAREVAVQNAEGQAEAARKMGEGEAARTLATMTAAANGNKATLLAAAEGNKAGLMATAEGNAALKGKVLLAEAEGTEALAAALAKMTDSAKLILILDRLPILLDHGGEAGAKVLRAMFESVAAGVGNIDQINITDIGGTGRGVEQVGGMVPKIVFDAVAGLKARGIDPSALLAKIGINAGDLMKKLGLTSAVKPEGAEKSA